LATEAWAWAAVLVVAATVTVAIVRAWTVAVLRAAVVAVLTLLTVVLRFATATNFVDYWNHDWSAASLVVKNVC